ncbi:MAG: glycerophosphodiester phosphodiesterase [Candidatus Limnocylindrales bacterium]
MGGRPLRLAHRGDWRVAPENSLAALVAGARAPRSDGVEFDVRLSRDHVPVVIHDATLARVQGLAAAVSALRADQLAEQGVARLEDVLAALPRRAFLDVELKVVPGPETVAVLAAGRGPELHGAVVSSFDLQALEAMAHLAPGWPRWLNTVLLDEAIVATAIALGCTGVASLWRSITPATARLVREAELELVAWTVRRRPTYRRLAGLGLAAICVEGSALDG